MIEISLKEVEETLIKVALRVAKRGEGALFVVGEADYNVLVDQAVPPFKALDNPKLLESLALIDGAVILDYKGIVMAYGAMIKTNSIMRNFGTRHSAAITASKKPGNLVVLVSEEDKKVRVLKEGRVIMQIDALQRGVEKSVPIAVQIMESIGAGTLGTIGTGLLAPSLGIALVPGVILFGSAYYLGKLITQRFNTSGFFSFLGLE
ncbi:DNA integrity scanning protein DisA nucleotide-binding domain protein [Candidatus Pacearchaeota archaeon]|nr:DNA integrity scanning protein DisA nucleotide-binding domain protein [Candidatus Pacearchaeota archaeon]